MLRASVWFEEFLFFLEENLILARLSWLGTEVKCTVHLGTVCFCLIFF